MGRETKTYKYAILTVDNLKLSAAELAALLAANTEVAAGELLVIVADNADKAATIQQLQNELSLSAKNTEGLQLQLQNSLQRIAQMESSALVLEQELEKARKALTEQQKMAADLDEQKAELETKLSDLEDTIRLLNARFDSLTNTSTPVQPIVSGTTECEHEGQRYKVTGSFKHNGNVITAAQAAADPMIIAHLVQKRSGMLEKI